MRIFPEYKYKMLLIKNEFLTKIYDLKKKKKKKNFNKLYKFINFVVYNDNVQITNLLSISYTFEFDEDSLFLVSLSLLFFREIY